MTPTQPHWLVVATPYTLAQVGVSIPDHQVSDLRALFDRHHRILGMREPMVSGWVLRPASDPRRSAMQICLDANLPSSAPGGSDLVAAARALDEGVSDASSEAWQFAYILRHPRTTCATPYTVCLRASRTQALEVNRFFRAFTTLTAALGKDATGASWYGWALGRQMDFPFLSIDEALVALRNELVAPLRSARAPLTEDAWSRFSAVQADVQALLLQDHTAPATKTDATSRL